MPGANKETTKPAWEFYDLQNDPKELKNVYDDPKHATIIIEMKKELLIQKELYGDSDEHYPIMKEIAEKYW